MVAPIHNRMRKIKILKEAETLVSVSITLMVWKELRILKVIFLSFCALETLGALAPVLSGLVDSLMRTRPGMNIRILEKNSTTHLRTMETGGCSGKTGRENLTAFMFANFSHQAGVSSLSKASGKDTLLEELTQFNLIVMKSLRKLTLRLIRMTNGLITLSIDLQLPKRPK